MSFNYPWKYDQPSGRSCTKTHQAYSGYRRGGESSPRRHRPFTVSCATRRLLMSELCGRNKTPFITVSCETRRRLNSEPRGRSRTRPDTHSSMLKLTLILDEAMYDIRVGLPLNRLTRKTCRPFPMWAPWLSSVVSAAHFTFLEKRLGPIVASGKLHSLTSFPILKN